MFARSARLALTTLGLLSFSLSADAAFSVATMFTVNGSSVTSVTPTSGLTFTASPLMVTSDTTMPNSYNFIQIEKSGQATNVDTTFTLNGTFTVVNNGVQTGMGMFTQSFRYQLDASGFGSLTRLSSTMPSVVGGIQFGSSLFSTPSVVPLVSPGVSRGNISTLVQQGAVPEPASIAMVGLGLAGLGGLAFRRRRRAA